jgi:hypothetical protein
MLFASFDGADSNFQWLERAFDNFILFLSFAKKFKRGPKIGVWVGVRPIALGELKKTLSSTSTSSVQASRSWRLKTHKRGCHSQALG